MSSKTLDVRSIQGRLPLASFTILHHFGNGKSGSVHHAAVRVWEPQLSGHGGPPNPMTGADRLCHVLKHPVIPVVLLHQPQEATPLYEPHPTPYAHVDTYVLAACSRAR